MSDLKAKVDQNGFRLALCPRPCWGGLLGAYSAAQGEGKGETGRGRGGT